MPKITSQVDSRTTEIDSRELELNFPKFDARTNFFWTVSECQTKETLTLGKN